MTLIQARCVIEVASCGTIKEASENLYISASAVSQTISSLEKELGVKLFERTRSGSELTSIGAIIYAQCYKMIESADEISRISTKANMLYSDTDANLIRVGLCNFAMPINPIIVDVARTYRLSIHKCAISDAEYLLDNGFLEFVLCSGTRSTQHRQMKLFAGQLINHVPLELVVRAGHPLTSQDAPIEPSSLGSEKWCFLTTDLNELLCDVLPDYNRDNLLFSSNCLEHILDIVRNTDAITLLPKYLIPNNLCSLDLSVGNSQPLRIVNYILFCPGLSDTTTRKNLRIYEAANNIITRLRNL